MGLVDVRFIGREADVTVLPAQGGGQPAPGAASGTEQRRALLGPTGYGLYRQIKALGHACLVVARKAVRLINRRLQLHPSPVQPRSIHVRPHRRGRTGNLLLYP
jgi:hypothetical protein